MLCILHGQCFAAETEQSRQEIWTALESEDYQEAYSLMLQLDSSGYRSADLYYDMGIAASHLDRCAESILYLEKAIKWGRSRARLSREIQRCQEKLDHQWTETRPHLLVRACTSLRDLMSSTYWALLVILFSLALGLWYLRHIARAHTPLMRLLRAAAITGMVLSLLFAVLRRVYEIPGPEALVMSADAGLYLSPALNAERLREVPAGTRVEQIDQIAGWALVILPNLEEGWIPESELEFY